jgi:hypothetical protein
MIQHASSPAMLTCATYANVLPTSWTTHHAILSSGCESTQMNTTAPIETVPVALPTAPLNTQSIARRTRSHIPFHSVHAETASHIPAHDRSHYFALRRPLLMPRYQEQKQGQRDSSRTLHHCAYLCANHWPRAFLRIIAHITAHTITPSTA